MCRESISENVKRRMYAESMGKCMNPTCTVDLFEGGGDIIEKAHIVPYCKTADNSFENLVVLCPNCHTKFDKLHLYTPEEVKSWKRIRQEEVQRFFSKKYDTFDELRTAVAPLLLENQTVYKNYYLEDSKELWDKFEVKVLINNKKLKLLLEKNRDLIQQHSTPLYSNLSLVNDFLLHIDEFEATRCDSEKHRKVLFPPEINSMFGIAPVRESMIPSTESLEALVTKLIAENKFEFIVLDEDNPYFRFIEDGRSKIVYLDDTPRLRQLYCDYNCFKRTGVRLSSLAFVLKYLNNRHVYYNFVKINNFREIVINGVKIVFVYEYCLSKAGLLQLAPDENSIVVNLHRWNSTGCISTEAYELAKNLNVKLFTQDQFFANVRDIKYKR